MADDFEVGAPPPEESSNRTFLIAAAAIGGLLILSMICLAVYSLVLAPRAREARLQEATQIVLENTRVAQALTEEAQGTRVTPTATATRTALATATSTRTQVVVLATATPLATGAVGQVREVLPKAISLPSGILARCAIVDLDGFGAATVPLANLEILQ